MDLFDFADESAEEPPRQPRAARGGPKVLTISQVTRKIRLLLESSVGDVWVTGEVSNLRKQQSGHTYFTLKDANAQLSCVLFRGDARFVTLQPAAGMQIRVFGEISVYEARGSYQMIVRKVETEGQGALQAKFEALKQKLNAEGLFATGHKREIPPFPSTVALVTSPTGAALRDVLNIFARRAPWVRVLVFPVPVQGEGAHGQIARAIRLLEPERLKQLPDIDTIIVCRGGGSIEDLWSFNEEPLARAIYQCSIPVISAVGHEIDFTIADFVADLRAPTPSAAAEIAVPDQAALRQNLQEMRSSLEVRARRQIDHARQLFEFRAKGALQREPRRFVRELQLRLDSLGDSLPGLAQKLLVWARQAVSKNSLALARVRPELVLERRANRVASLGARLEGAAAAALKERTSRISKVSALLGSLGPASVFKRGFSLTTDTAGKPVRRASEVSPGDQIVTRLASGKLTSTVESTDNQQ
jgi:exodeoxyribonuclease VII large subunit